MTFIAQDFGGVPVGPGWVRSYEPQTGTPVDGSKASLRDPATGSPFSFSFQLPPSLVDALLEGRNQDIGLIDSALQANNNLKKVRQQTEKFAASSFVATRATDLRVLEDVIATNGFRYNPRNAERSRANQTALSDLDQALNVILQINRIINTPKLTLLVNPQSMTITYSKIQQYTDRNRFNYIFQSWGEQQPRISVSGKTGGFYALPNTIFNGDADSVTGLQYASKPDSAAWQNLMSLFTMYRNNGYLFDLLGGTEAHLWVGSVVIEYDQKVYVGNFDSFNYGYNEGNQHNVEFSFEFTVSQEFDVAQNTQVIKPQQAPTPSPSDVRWSSNNAPPFQEEPAPLERQQVDTSNTTVASIFNPLVL